MFFCRRGGWNDVVSREFKEVCVSSQQLKSDMSVVYLLLGGPDALEKCDPFVKGIITPDGFRIFSIYDFMQIVLISNEEPRSHTYVKKLWKTLCKCYSQFMEVKGTLGLAVPRSKMRKTEPKKGATVGTTVAGLKGVLDVLDKNHVSE
jgi:hypothetical protein